MRSLPLAGQHGDWWAGAAVILQALQTHMAKASWLQTCVAGDDHGGLGAGDDARRQRQAGGRAHKEGPLRRVGQRGAGAQRRQQQGDRGHRDDAGEVKAGVVVAAALCSASARVGREGRRGVLVSVEGAAAHSACRSLAASNACSKHACSEGAAAGRHQHSKRIQCPAHVKCRMPQLQVGLQQRQQWDPPAQPHLACGTVAGRQVRLSMKCPLPQPTAQRAPAAHLVCSSRVLRSVESATTTVSAAATPAVQTSRQLHQPDKNSPGDTAAPSSREALGASSKRRTG